MKKVLRIAAIFTLLLVLCCFAQPAAASTDDVVFAEYDGNVLRCSLRVMRQNGNTYALFFDGSYFGAGIPVELTVYSSPSFPLDCFDKTDSASIAKREEIVGVFRDVDSLVTLVDSLCNTQYDGKEGRPLSDVRRYNDAAFGETIPVDPCTFEMLSVAREMWEATDGAFNPAVYRLVDLWGFSSRLWSQNLTGEIYPYDRQMPSLPDDAYVKAFADSAFIDFDGVVLSRTDEGCFVTKNVQDVTVYGESFSQWIDLGGVAKGYVADCANGKLRQLGVDCFFASVGESSLAFGKTGEVGNFRVDVSDPYGAYGQSCLGIFAADSVSSTSGQYLRKYVVDGVEYSHIIDSATGAPAQTGVKEVCVMAADGKLLAAESDCLTTALTVMGRDGIVGFMNGYAKRRNLKVFAVYEAVDGTREILSNATSEVVTDGTNASRYRWAVSETDGVFTYIGKNAENGNFTVALVAAFCAICAVTVALAVVFTVKGKPSDIAKIKGGKPFRQADVMVYLSLFLVVAILFGMFFGQGNSAINTVTVTDMQTQEVLFVYNVSRGQYTVNEADGWTVAVEKADDGYLVTFSKDFNGKNRFNVMKITTRNGVFMKMTDSECGSHQDCVVTFPALYESGGTVVCSPNRLKITTE